MDNATCRLQQFEPQLLDYLTQRFGSAPLARRVTEQTLQTLGASPILDCIGNPRDYITGYALALALRYDGGRGTRESFL